MESLKLILYWSGLLFFLLLEMRFAYRSPSVSKLRRWLANLPLSIVNGTVYHFIYFAALTNQFSQIQAQQLGLLNQFGLPDWSKILLGILLLDFTIYIWHLLNHEVPFFWRFHRVHHSDLNMDVSTANRFHLGEILLSGLLRLAVIYTLGIPLFAYFLFEVLVNISIQLHHSSIRVSPRFEAVWVKLFVPPSMHRVHHSVRIKERDSNYGVIFSFWDRLMGTFTSGVEQSGIIIGLGSHRNFDRLGFWHLNIMPLTRMSR